MELAYLPDELEGPEECRVYLVVVATTADVAHWASEPISLDNPGSAFIPLVLGPRNCPRIQTVEIAAQHPELAVLSAILHAGEEAEVADFAAGFVGALALEGEQAIFYADLVLEAAGKLAPKVLEAIMSTSQGYEPKSEFARMHWLKGQIEATAKAVVKVLEARGLPFSEHERGVILSSTDLPTLEHWHSAAVTVSSVQELLSSEPSQQE